VIIDWSGWREVVAGLVILLACFALLCFAVTCIPPDGPIEHDDEEDP
jgi:hypothetical protein